MTKFNVKQSFLVLLGVLTISCNVVKTYWLTNDPATQSGCNFEDFIAMYLCEATYVKYTTWRVYTEPVHNILYSCLLTCFDVETV